MSERLSPEAVVELFDDLFTQFDVMPERRGLEKIKTVGDAYMVVGGVPEAAANAAEDVADMALEMVALVAHRPGPHGGSLSVRIGIDTGPVVAGVIGRASSHATYGATWSTQRVAWSHKGSPARSKSPRVYQQLKHQFRSREREALHVKGKGQIAPFLLVGRAGQPTS